MNLPMPSWASGFSGMEWWTGTLEWNNGMDWNDGMVGWNCDR